MDKILVVFVLLGAGIAVCLASNVGETCTSDDNCSSYGQYCKIYSNCDGKGECSCKSGYQGVGSGCKQIKLIDESCDSNSYCPVAATCTSSKCQCNSGTRTSSDKKYCVSNASNVKLVGESCTTGTHNCFKITGTSDSATTTSQLNVNCQSGTCQCTDGYKASGAMCVLYGYSESCSTSTSTPKTCDNTLSYVCQTSSGTTGTCVCISAHTYYSPEKKCVYTAAGRNVAEGKSCNHDGNSESNQWCASGLVCTNCPSGSTTSKVCRKEVSDGATTVSLSLVAVAAVLVNLFL